MRTMKSIAVAAAALMAGSSAAAAVAATSSSTAPPPVRQVQGSVVGVQRNAHTFRVRDRVRGVLTVKVTTRTRYEHMAGFSAVRNRARLQIRAQRIGGVWRAVSVAPVTQTQSTASSPTVGQHDGTPDRDRIQDQDRDGTGDHDQIRDRDRISQ